MCAVTLHAAHILQKMRLLTPADTLRTTITSTQMNYQSEIKIYKRISNNLFLGVIVFPFFNYFFQFISFLGGINITIGILLLALFFRFLMERTRRKETDANNCQLTEKIYQIEQQYNEALKKYKKIKLKSEVRDGLEILNLFGALFG